MERGDFEVIMSRIERGLATGFGALEVRAVLKEHLENRVVPIM